MSLMIFYYIYHMYILSTFIIHTLQQYLKASTTITPMWFMLLADEHTVCMGDSGTLS